MFVARVVRLVFESKNCDSIPTTTSQRRGVWTALGEDKVARQVDVTNLLMSTPWRLVAVGENQGEFLQPIFSSVLQISESIFAAENREDFLLFTGSSLGSD